MLNFDVVFEESNQLIEVQFEQTNMRFDVDFGELHNLLPDPYTGSYEVTPLIHNAVVLPTQNKSMLDNVTVKKTPQYEVTNPQGGMTLTIGDDNLNSN